MKKHIVLFFSFLITLCDLSAQAMWPGDANNNGVANGADFVYYGLAHGSQGPQRPNASPNWVPQTIAPWSQSFANGVNYAFADFDGDGEVDNSDQSKFEANWGKTHGSVSADGYGASVSGASVRVKLFPGATQVAPGASLNIEVRIGDPTHPVTGLYGLAFKMHYSQDLVNSGGSDIEFNDLSGSWFDGGGASRHFFQKNENIGRAETGLTRTNQMPVSGQGAVGSFSIIIEDIIVGRLRDTLDIVIDSLIVFDANGNASGAEGDTIQVIVVDPSAAAPDNTPGQKGMQIAPNPVSGSFLYVHTPTPVESATLTDLNGRVVWRTLFEAPDTRMALEKPHLPPGIYMLKMQGKAQVWQGWCIFAP
jgi:hypothetical protein